MAKWPLPQISAAAPVKRALLIGISHTRGLASLTGPEKDVDAMRKLLLEQYSYPENNIRVLSDTAQDATATTLPTYSAILKSIGWLVAGARAGDSLFFHYAGHVAQKPNRTGTEADGQDESIVAAGGEEIDDNLLRVALVDSLPVGCQLVAVFDSCHSATILDLDHCRCNRLFIPGISSGLRRRVIRVRSVTGCQSSPSSVTETLPLTSGRPSKRGLRLATEPQYRLQPSITLTTMSWDSTWHPNLRQSPVAIENLPLECDEDDSVEGHTDLTLPVPSRCESPVYNSATSTECDGHCRDLALCAYTNSAEVFCLSSCKDQEQTWETPRGNSMTQTLVAILQQNPHPTLRDLLTDLSYAAYKAAHQLQEDRKEYVRLRNAWRNGREYRQSQDEGPLVDTSNFSTPQISTRDRAVDFDRRWAL